MGVWERLNRLLGKAEPIPESSASSDAVPLERRAGDRADARLGTRVLIIDDSPTIVAVLRKFLRSSGYQTFEALNAENGIEIARRVKPELIFLDIVLPGMNGFAALRTLRHDPGLREIPVIMMSGNEQATEQFFGGRIGADDFMRKPFSRREVFTRIARTLDENRVPRRVARTKDTGRDAGTKSKTLDQPSA